MTATVNPSAHRSPRVAILSSVHLALDNRVFYREARTLAGAGYDVTVIAVHAADEVRDGIRIRALPQVPRRERPRLWRRLLLLAEATQADLYHFHDPELLLISGLLRQRTGRPTIYDIHEVYPEFIEVKEYIPAPLRRPIAGAMRTIEPGLARRESGLIFADDQIAAAFAHPTQPQATLYNFPDTSILAPSADRGNGLQRPPVILYLGGMERNRGTAVMIDAFARVLQQRPDARLLLVGHFAPPELEQEVRQHARTLAIDHAITISDRVPFDVVPSYLAQAAIGWVPWQAARKNELNIPTKLFEYMAGGLPVVASDLASMRPFVQPGVNGYLVDAAGVDAHARALLDLLADPAEAAELGRNGQQLVRTRFNWSAMAPRLLDLYAQVLGVGQAINLSDERHQTHTD
jgi:glycosyltransferase involved in cell wall biosynthesis